ncbi:MAG: histidine kinase [Acidobacteria bacterium]|nr:histidine kinase [Acidobacteriota bacterium]
MTLLACLLAFQFPSETYDAANGLDSPTVLSVHAHQAGRLWVGTYEGLLSFDGHEFSHASQLPISRVRRIVDGNSVNWVASFSGLFDLSHAQRVTELDNVYDVLETDEGLWIGTGTGLFLFHDDSLTAVDLGLESPRVLRLVAFQQGMWVGTDQGLFRFENGGFENIQLTSWLAAPAVYDIATSLGVTWFATDLGLVKLERDHLTHFAVGEGLPHHAVWCVTIDSRGWVWAGTDAGSALSKSGARFATVNPSDPLGYTTIYAIEEDDEGSMWFGTCTGLIHMVEPLVNASLDLAINTSGILEHSSLGLLRGTPQGIWTDDSFLLEAPFVRTMLESRDGSIWAATREGVIKRTLAGEIVVFDADDGLSDTHVLHLARASEKQILAATLSGLFKGGMDGFERMPWSRNIRVHGSIWEPDGIYAATERGVLFSDAPTRQTARSLLDEEAFCLMMTKRYGLVTGTAHGLVTLPEGTRYSPETRVHALAEDEYGNLWAGTNRGLERFTGHRLSRVWPHEGSLESNLNALQYLSDERLILGHYDGSIAWDTKPLSASNTLRGQSELTAELGGQPLTNNTSFTQASDPFKIVFKASSLKYTHHYALEIQQNDQTWRQQTNPLQVSRDVVGAHQLKARATFPDGSHSPELKFGWTIKPPIWKTPWFIGLCLLVLCVLAAREMRQLRTKNQFLALQARELADRFAMEQAERLHREAEIRMLHSQMNPHFLQNAFNTAIAQLKRAPDQTEHLLRQLAVFFRRHMQANPDIWATVSQETELAESFLSIQKMRFNDRLSYHIHVRDEARALRIPALMLQPLLENATLHGLKQTTDSVEVSLEIDTVEEFVEIRVSNDGDRSLDHQWIKEGHALDNIQKRLAMMDQQPLTYSFAQNRHLFILRIGQP